MKISTQYGSPLKMENLLISECSFKRSEENIQNLTIKADIKHELYTLSENKYKVSLELSLGDRDKKIEVFVKCIAYFETEQSDALLIKNALAIMFPYVRSHVTLMTSQPGMLPIVLPPINIVAVLQNE